MPEPYELGYKAGYSEAISPTLRELVPEAREIIENQDTIDFVEKITRVVESIPEGPNRSKLLKKIKGMIHRERAALVLQIEGKDKSLNHLRSAVDAYERIEPWFSGDLKLQKPIGTMIHAFREALAENHIFYLPSRAAALSDSDLTAWDEMAAQASVFMVQHNWADAFKNARDYLGGEIRLPDDVCAFEFRISDRHVIVFATEADGLLYLQIAVQVKKGWLLMYVRRDALNSEDPLDKLTSEQVRAIAVALDAEIATTEIIRAPHKLNHAREKAGKLPLVSYHVVNLAHRSRGTPLEPSDNELAYHVRLHFRRGHWRHYEDHKTWIKWMLVGDPELGFVDKEYRL